MLILVKLFYSLMFHKYNQCQEHGLQYEDDLQLQHQVILNENPLIQARKLILRLFALHFDILLCESLISYGKLGDSLFSAVFLINVSFLMLFDIYSHWWRNCITIVQRKIIIVILFIILQPTKLIFHFKKVC